MEAVLNDLDAGRAVQVTPDVRARFVADLKMSGITGGMVVGPSPGETAIVSFLTAIEGSPPTEDGGVNVWWFRSTE
jgi:hypothetical protein